MRVLHCRFDGVIKRWIRSLTRAWTLRGKPSADLVTKNELSPNRTRMWSALPAPPHRAGRSLRFRDRQYSSYPTASIAGTDGPAAAMARTAVATSGDSLITSTVPCSTSPNPVAVSRSIDDIPRVALFHAGGNIAGGRQLEGLEQVGQESVPLGSSPESEADATLWDQDASRLFQGTLARPSGRSWLTRRPNARTWRSAMRTCRRGSSA